MTASLLKKNLYSRRS